MAAAGPALAGNTVKLDISGAGTGVVSLSINQDPTNPSNIISTDGTTGGSQIAVRGKWQTLSITQNGATNVLKSSGISGTTGSTTASLNLTYGSGTDGGNNIHSLTIGQTTAPANASITATVVNTDPTNTANTITDTLDGTSLTYTLDIAGTNNSVTNAVAATGANSISITLHGAVESSGNTVTNTVSNATSSNITILATSNNNVITNTSNTAGAKTFSVTLPNGGTDGNVVTNDFTGGGGTQSSTLLVTGTTSKVNYGLTASGNGTTANVTLADVVGAAGAAGKLVLAQSGAGDSLSLTVNGGTFTMGSSLTGSSGVRITQASPGAALSATINAGGNGYTYSISQ
jgi:hypothetical protein